LFLVPVIIKPIIKKKTKTASENTSFDDIHTDYETWWSYHARTVSFDLDFVPLDVEGNQMTRGEFYEALKSGQYIVKRTSKKEKDLNYQLIKIFFFF